MCTGPFARHTYPEAWNACRGGPCTLCSPPRFWLPPAHVCLCAGLCSLGPQPLYDSSCTNPAGAPASPSCWTVCAHLVLFSQVATPCSFNDAVQDRDSALQERDAAKQELDNAKQELQASNKHNIVLSQQLGVAQDSLRATESSCHYFQAHLQQVGLSLCSADPGLSL